MEIVIQISFELLWESEEIILHVKKDIVIMSIWIVWNIEQFYK